MKSLPAPIAFGVRANRSPNLSSVPATGCGNPINSNTGNTVVPGLDHE
jgi:hypothetical protein